MDRPVRAAPKRVRGRSWALVAVTAGGLAAGGVALTRVGSAAPSIQRASVFLATVTRGDMRIEVRGPGTLSAEHLRVVPSIVPGRIERRAVRAGDSVAAGALLMELQNAEVEIDAWEATRQLRAAEAAYQDRRVTLDTQRLAQAALVAAARSAFRQAERRLQALEELAARGDVAEAELADARDRTTERREQLRLEEERLTILAETTAGQLQSLAAQVEAARAIATFQASRRASLRVLAGLDGVVQELPVEEGAWVSPGDVLAKLAGADRLKAVLRIPEQDAQAVAVGLPALVQVGSDTVTGTVSRVDAAVQGGSVAVDVAFPPGTLPTGVRTDLRVDGTIWIAVLPGALFVRRVSQAQAGTRIGVYRVRGDEATLVPVEVGRLSADHMEVRSGLTAGDHIIVSDLREQRGATRLLLR